MLHKMSICFVDNFVVYMGVGYFMIDIFLVFVHKITLYYFFVCAVYICVIRLLNVYAFI